MHILRVPHKGHIDPPQRVLQFVRFRLVRLLLPEATHLLHQAMHRESGCFCRAVHQGIALQLADRLPAIAAAFHISCNLHSEQALGYGLWREPGQPSQ